MNAQSMGTRVATPFALLNPLGVLPVFICYRHLFDRPPNPQIIAR
jgi:hypothetical protein